MFRNRTILISVKPVLRFLITGAGNKFSSNFLIHSYNNHTLHGPSDIKCFMNKRISYEGVQNPNLLNQILIRKLSNSNKLPEGLTSRLVKETDFEPVLIFLRERFFRDEPLYAAIDLLENGDRCVDLEKLIIGSLKENMSIIATDENDKIVGVSVNGYHKKNNVTKLMDTIIDCKNSKLKKILHLLYMGSKKSDIFGEFPDVKVVVDSKITSIDKAYRGKGLYKYLIKQSMKLVKEKNIRILRCECTGAYSAKAVMKLGGQKIYSIKYATTK